MRRYYAPHHARHAAMLLIFRHALLYAAFSLAAMPPDYADFADAAADMPRYAMLRCCRRHADATPL